jgi:hypothetical protein
LNGASLVSVSLETGRTHQIRVHFLSIGHPVVGDRVYRARAASGGPPEAARQMLHARRLGFAHPSTGVSVLVEAAPPADFTGVLAALRRGVRRAAPARAAPGPERGKTGKTGETGETGERAPGIRPGEKTHTREKPRSRGAFRDPTKRSTPGTRRGR